VLHAIGLLLNGVRRPYCEPLFGVASVGLKLQNDPQIGQTSDPWLINQCAISGKARNFKLPASAL
jgi:hypothetical protein